MTNIFLWPVLACLVTSFGTCLLIILTQRWHGRLSLDHDLNGIQKIHEIPVPRIGGVGVIAGLTLAGLFSYAFGGETYETAGILLLCGLPVFSAGLIEDFTKSVGVSTRLIASFISAALAYWILDAELIRLDTPGLDNLIKFSFISFFFTCFAVGGLTNAINIIDGLNGLASGSVTLMLGGLAVLAWLNGDTLILNMCLWGIAAAIGFLLLNYPFGRIFLGDGGAYLVGFWAAECGILLLKRNPTISTWAVLLACIYPVWETIYTIYRRKVVAKVNSGSPDTTHLHHIAFKTLARKGSKVPAKSWVQHGLVSIQIWSTVGASQAVAIFFYKSHAYLAISTIVFATAYTLIHIHGLRKFSLSSEPLNTDIASSSTA